ncbi:methyl-accepting chemotaxis protein [Metabacillus fastidiosus]|uniref:methyl-accepting chemotaxis protein n=1 Tax=Metabacillus fastidiosus TaxID=1458 RepID=UPI002DBBC2F4|nr:methyl-accepting chemotaxis protein [Metabacillus fastidiosus]MEC2077272.1 methyl-accepting chemotaxis protein [Metabacillus fastidiosus]
MKGVLKFNIRTKLILSFAVLLLVPSVTIGILAYTSAKHEVRNQIELSSSENIELLDSMITNILTSKLDAADYFSSMIIPELLKNEGSLQLVDEFKLYTKVNSDVTRIYVGTNSGGIILYPETDLEDNYDPRSRPWYQEAMKNAGRTIITEPYQSATGETLVTVAKETKGGTGVIGLDINIDAIKETVEKIKIGKEGYAFLLSKEKKVINHSTYKPGEEVKEGFYNRLYESSSGVFDYVLNNEEKMMSFATNKLTGWKIAGTMDVKEVDESAHSIFVKTFTTVTLSLILGALLTYFIIRSIIGPIRSLMVSAKVISQGDLIEEIHIKNKDEIGELADAFKEMTDNLKKLISQVHINTEHVAAASEELTASADQSKVATEHVAAAIQQVASGAESQTDSINETADSMSNISKGMEKMTDNFMHVNEITKQTVSHAEEGDESVRKTVEQMNTIYRQVSDSDYVIKSLYDRSKQIDEIINVISGIADQTNLLALNAAIEAARAGEQGKGFAVVADEVRKLAEQSQQSAKQIAELIKEIQADTANSVETMGLVTGSVKDGLLVSDETIEKFREILAGVRAIAPQMEEVSNIALQISSEVQTVTATMFEIANISKENSAASESVAASTEEQLASLEEVNLSAKSLSSMAEELQGLVRIFKV